MKKPELLVIGIDGAMPSYIKDSIAKGKLPAFKKLIENGVLLNDCMTAYSSITPACWAAITTGAVASVTGAYCEAVHVNGAHPTECITPYRAENIHAERFWEAAERIGKKSLLIDVPTSAPNYSENITIVKGGMDATPIWGKGNPTGIPSQVFRINTDDDIYNDGVKLIGGGDWQRFKNSDCTYTKTDDKTYIFDVKYSENHVPGEVENFTWTVIVEDDGMKIGATKEEAEKSETLILNEWSPLLTRELKTDDGKTTTFRFKAMAELFDKENGSYVVFVTGTRNYKKEIKPLKFAEEVCQKVNEVDTGIAIKLWFQPELLDRYIEIEECALNWQRKLLSHALENYDNDIIFDYIGFTDTINHRFRSAYEKLAPNWEKEYELAVDAYEKTYDIVDKHISWLMENVADENTRILIISDHGAVGYDHNRLNQCRALEDAGLITYIDPDGDKSWKNQNVDWSKTKAYPVGCCHINVNLKGREPVGIVEPEDYEKTVYDIIRALQKGVETDDGLINALAFAVEKEQAGFIGHGGENCGDVVYGIIGSRLGGAYGGVHAHQIPSARSKTGDIRSLCIMSGNGFKKNVELSRPTDLTDFAPTLCFAMGYPQPKDATGGVIFQALEDRFQILK